MMVRIELGQPTAEELAALISVVVCRPRAPEADSAAPASRWAGSARPAAAHRPGAGGWRASALPR